MVISSINISIIIVIIIMAPKIVEKHEGIKLSTIKPTDEEMETVGQICAGDSKAKVPAMSCVDFSTEAFGVPDFAWCDRSKAGWLILRNRPAPMLATPPGMQKLFHGTTLAQCQEILQSGFFVGMCHEGSMSSPAGIWGCSVPEHCVDRAPLDRGYSHAATNRLDRGIVCGWDYPVVFAWDLEEERVRKHETLSDGSQICVHKQPCGTIWDARNRPTSIWIHEDLYDRFCRLPSWWPKLQSGAVVACRSRHMQPFDLYQAGNAAPMTCARVCVFEELKANGWRKARESKQWRCPSCDNLKDQGKPCTEIPALWVLYGRE